MTTKSSAIMETVDDGIVTSIEGDGEIVETAVDSVRHAVNQSISRCEGRAEGTAQQEGRVMTAPRGDVGLRNRTMNLRRTGVCVALLAIAVALQGCLLFVAGAAAGAGVGVVSYSGNELRVTREVGVDRAWEAVEGALQELQWPVIAGETHKDAAGGALMARNSNDQPVHVQLARQSDRLTEIRIRVGTFSTAANHAAGQLLYEKMKARL